MIEFAHRSVKQLALGLNRAEGNLRKVPRLSEGEAFMMAAIELAAGRPLSEVELRKVADGEAYRFLGPGRRRWVLRKLIRAGLIEVVSLSPGVYRSTKLGRIAWGMR